MLFSQHVRTRLISPLWAGIFVTVCASASAVLAQVVRPSPFPAVASPVSSAVADSEEAKIFREKLTKAESGDAQAQVSVGDVFMQGNRRAGVQPNFVVAEGWYLKAASQGYVRAFEKLSSIHHSRALALRSQGKSESEELIEAAKFGILAGDGQLSFRISEGSLAEARRRADVWRGQPGATASVRGYAPQAPGLSSSTSDLGGTAGDPASGRVVSIVVGKGVQLDTERRNAVGQVWAEMKKGFSLSLDADLESGLSGLPLEDNEECLDAFYRFLAKHPLTRSMSVRENCAECKGSGVKIVYSKDPRLALSFERTICAVCMGGGKQDVMVTYSILCDAARVPVKGETPRIRRLKALLVRVGAGDPSARLQYAGYLLKGEQGVSRDVEKAKELYKGLVLSGVSDALLGLRDAIEVSVGKNVDDKRFIMVLTSASDAIKGVEPARPKAAVTVVDETARRMDAVGQALGAKPVFDVGLISGNPAAGQPTSVKSISGEPKHTLSYLDEAGQAVVVGEFVTLFKSRLLTPAHLSYSGLLKSLAGQPRAAGDYRSLMLNWLLKDKRTTVDLALMKDLKANAVQLEPLSLAFLAGISEEGLVSAPNPLAAYVLFKMAYVQTGKTEYLDQTKRLEGAINKDLAQQVLFEFENLRRSKLPLNTYVDSVLSLK